MTSERIINAPLRLSQRPQTRRCILVLIRVPANRISQIINGKRSITGDTALRLAHWFGTNPQFWMNLQNQHDVRLAERVAGAEISALPTRPAQTCSS